MLVTDPVGQKLVEWALLRHAESEARFERYATFINANPDWPSIPLLRQRAEMRLQEPRYRPSARGFLGGVPTGSVDGHSLKHETRWSQERDERWREIRGLARRLIDLGDAATAYRVVREAAPPGNPYYRAEYHFMAGWIALRFLNDPSTALGHFARIDEGSTEPIVRAVLLTGAAAQPKLPDDSKRCALSTRRLLATPPPITASWRTPGSARDPKVDAVDWVERIPFAETRNYVQRVMENLQVYCARFGASTATLEPNLHRSAPVGSRTKPVLVQAFP
jgi:hypothetical protein